MASFGTKLQNMRDLAGFTQREFARAIGSQQSRISKWEKDDGDPSVQTLAKIVEVLRRKVPWVTLDYLCRPELEEPEDARSLRVLTTDEEFLWTLIQEIGMSESRRRLLLAGIPYMISPEPDTNPPPRPRRPSRQITQHEENTPPQTGSKPIASPQSLRSIQQRTFREEDLPPPAPVPGSAPLPQVLRPIRQITRHEEDLPDRRARNADEEPAGSSSASGLDNR